MPENADSRDSFQRGIAISAGPVLVGVAAFYLLTEHMQHTLGALPYALVLILCLFMHRYMHRDH